MIMWNKTIWRIYFLIKENILLECILLLACTVFFLILYLDLPQGGIDNLQITISQILATIFTLVFAITIFAAQMMGTFTAMDKMIDNWTKRYMAIFAFGIILPLIQLSTDKDLFDIDFTLSIFRITTEKLNLGVDLFIATFCIFALIPYSIKVNKIMKYEGGISKLYQKASEAIDSNHIETAIINIFELVDLGQNSLQDGQAYTMDIIHKLTLIAEAVKKRRSERLAKIFMHALGYLGVKAVHDEKIIIQRIYAKFDNDPNHIGYVLPYIIYQLKDIGIKAIDWDISDNSIQSYSCKNLFNIGFEYDLLRFNKIVKPGKRHLFNLAGFIMGENYCTNTKCIVYYLLEIANKSLSKKEYIFCWDSVSGQEDIEFRTFLKEDKDASDYSFHIISKSNDGKEINLSKNYSTPNNSQVPYYSFKLNEEKNIVILTDNLVPYIIYEKVFSAEKRNGKTNIYKFKFEKTLEYSLFYLWVFGANFMKDSPEDGRIMANTIKSYKHVNKTIIDLFESDYIREKTERYVYEDPEMEELSQTKKIELIQKIEDYRKVYDDI